MSVGKRYSLHANDVNETPEFSTSNFTRCFRGAGESVPLSYSFSALIILHHETECAVKSASHHEMACSWQHIRPWWNINQAEKELVVATIYTSHTVLALSARVGWARINWFCYVGILLSDSHPRSVPKIRCTAVETRRLSWEFLYGCSTSWGKAETVRRKVVILT